MLTRTSIRQRILITFVLIAVTGAVVQFTIAGRQLETATLEFHQHHLETDALLLAATFTKALSHSDEQEDGRDLSQLLATFQQQVGHQYVLLDSSYRVAAASADLAADSIGRLAVTPELTQARENNVGADIRPDASGQSTLYVAVPVRMDDSPPGYLVLSEPMAPAWAAVRQRYLELAAATVPVLLLVIGASLWVSGTISHPIQRLRNSALRMARGELDTRIPVSSSDEIGQLAEAFNYMAGQIEGLITAQRSFVSNAAHELRTPLMTLKLRLEALAEDGLPPAERETYLSESRQEIDHMAHLVSSLLTLARIDEGRHQRGGIVSDPIALIGDITRRWRIEAEARGLGFSAELPPELPDLAITPNDLRLVLDNVLSNAIKYTLHGAISLRAHSAGGRVLIDVRDSGIGFRAEQQQHLFERFFRSEDVRGRMPGTGLGLAVTRAVLEVYGGAITAESAGPGQGASFCISLPAAAA